MQYNSSRLAARTTHAAEAGDGAPELGREPDPVRGTQDPRVDDPGAPAQHAERRGTSVSDTRGNKGIGHLWITITVGVLVITIFHLLPCVAVHVEES